MKFLSCGHLPLKQYFSGFNEHMQFEAYIVVVGTIFLQCWLRVFFLRWMGRTGLETVLLHINVVEDRPMHIFQSRDMRLKTFNNSIEKVRLGLSCVL